MEGSSDARLTYPLSGLAYHAARSEAAEYIASGSSHGGYSKEVDLRTDGPLLLVPILDSKGRWFHTQSIHSGLFSSWYSQLAAQTVLFAQSCSHCPVHTLPFTPCCLYCERWA